MDNEKKLIGVNFSEKQVGKISNHKYEKDKEGQPLKIMKVILPSAEFRNEKFGVDIHGIDRDARKAYVNFPANAVFEDREKPDRRYIYLDENFYNKKYQTGGYRVFFEQKPTGQVDTKGKPIWDKPEDVFLTAQELKSVLQGRKTIIKEKETDAPVRTEKEKTAEKEQQKTVKKQTKTKTKKSKEIER